MLQQQTQVGCRSSSACSPGGPCQDNWASQIAVARRSDSDDPRNHDGQDEELQCQSSEQERSSKQEGCSTTTDTRPYVPDTVIRVMPLEFPWQRMEGNPLAYFTFKAPATWLTEGAGGNSSKLQPPQTKPAARARPEGEILDAITIKRKRRKGTPQEFKILLTQNSSTTETSPRPNTPPPQLPPHPAGRGMQVCNTQTHCSPLFAVDTDQLPADDAFAKAADAAYGDIVQQMHSPTPTILDVRPSRESAVGLPTRPSVESLASAQTGKQPYTVADAVDPPYSHMRDLLSRPQLQEGGASSQHRFQGTDMLLPNMPTGRLPLVGHQSSQRPQLQPQVQQFAAQQLPDAYATQLMTSGTTPPARNLTQTSAWPRVEALRVPQQQQQEPATQQQVERQAQGDSRNWSSAHSQMPAPLRQQASSSTPYAPLNWPEQSGVQGVGEAPLGRLQWSQLQTLSQGAGAGASRCASAGADIMTASDEVLLDLLKDQHQPVPHDLEQFVQMIMQRRMQGNEAMPVAPLRQQALPPAQAQQWALQNPPQLVISMNQDTPSQGRLHGYAAERQATNANGWQVTAGSGVSGLFKQLSAEPGPMQQQQPQVQQWQHERLQALANVPPLQVTTSGEYHGAQPSMAQHHSSPRVHTEYHGAQPAMAQHQSSPRVHTAQQFANGNSGGSAVGMPGFDLAGELMLRSQQMHCHPQQQTMLLPSVAGQLPQDAPNWYDNPVHAGAHFGSLDVMPGSSLGGANSFGLTPSLLESLLDNFSANAARHCG